MDAETVTNLIQQGAHAQAIEGARVLVAQSPTEQEHWHLLGMAALYGDELALSEEAFQRGLMLDPLQPVFHFGLGLARHKAGQKEDAKGSFARAVALDPSYGQAQRNLAQTMLELGDLDGSLSAFQKATTQDPGNPLAWEGLGDVCYRLNRPCDAKEAYGKALALPQASAGLRYKEALLLPLLPKSSEQEDAWRTHLDQSLEALEQDPPPLSDPVREVGRTLYYLSYHGRDDRKTRERLAQLFLKSCPDLGYIAPHARPEALGGPPPDGPVTVAFISSNLGQHTVGDLNRAMIRNLDRTKVCPVIFYLGEHSAKDLELVESCCEDVRPLNGPLPYLRQEIAKSEAHVAYFTDIGMDPLTYFLGFSKLAPVQCLTWGHGETTGIPAMDAFISLTEGECETGQEQYSEELVLMDLSINIPEPPPIDPNIDRKALGLPEDKTLYGCPQSTFKLHPDFDAPLAEILRRDEKAVILMLGSGAPFWRETFETRFRKVAGEELAQHIHYLPKLKHKEFLAMLAACDVLIDPPHFGGGKTTLESFWAGTPVVARYTPILRGRLTHAFYKIMGVKGGLAKTLDEFVEIAVSLGTNPAANQALREEITAKRSVLFHSEQAVRDHEAFFLNAVKKAYASSS